MNSIPKYDELLFHMKPSLHLHFDLVSKMWINSTPFIQTKQASSIISNTYLPYTTCLANTTLAPLPKGKT